ncbi:DEAD/DEAH box helicase [candidate division KSB1 bacterium]|nr:DEAD/DEAH box helicase [candidate division KSB1 bacterium]
MISTGEKNTLLELPFHPATARWFIRTFPEPSPPQVKGWPVIAAGRHSLILAPTGSGKTLAAFLWCIDDLIKQGENVDPVEFEQNLAGVHTLYISPLKALNNDIYRNLQTPLQGIERSAKELEMTFPAIRTTVRTGDTPQSVRQQMVKKPPHILITTPESLYLLLTSTKGRLIFRNVKYIIVDEIHAVCNSKRGVHLSLSLERLIHICCSDPVRIGLSATQRPLQRIAAFLGGQNPETSTPRPVKIVDCGQRKNMDLKVMSPVSEYTDLPEATIWPKVTEMLYGMIISHRSTLIFVNMRAQTERVSRLLNEFHRKTTGDPDAELALAHHGSISRELRYKTETRLKNGDIPAVVATASLELGIDIGHIDLVVQLETPKTVASALQRIGRSGHLVSSTSKGCIIPLYQADLDDAAALTMCMQKARIEETVIPENCLDVLAQQILAEVAMQDWDRPALYRLYKSSYPYRNMTENTFNAVVDMLAGRFEKTEIRSLIPKITWDRVNDRLLAHKGARLTALINGGTIPDRAYYGVYLQGDNTRIGDVEEEFVFESKVGEVFFLGSNEWKITDITRDRIMVTPLKSTKPKAPFWKGDLLYRDLSTSREIGAFRGQLFQKIKDGTATAWLTGVCQADLAIAANIQEYFIRQSEKTQAIPTDKTVVIERFKDESDEPQIIIHAPFGGRINGAWAIIVAAVIERDYKVQVQYSYDDDGFILRLLDTTEKIPIIKILSERHTDVRQILIENIDKTPLFAIRFRQNAVRALLLQRSRLDKRIPLWLQRLRSSDLLQVVREFKDFPILVETYRECLQDIFDLANLEKICRDIHHQKIRLHLVDTTFPSPMASGLLFRFLAENMYEYDQYRAAGTAADVSSELLAEILSKESIPTLVTADIVEQAENVWQFLTPERRIKHTEDMFQVIDQLGPVDEKNLAERCPENMQQMLEKLSQDKRIERIPVGWINVEKKSLFREQRTTEHLNALVTAYLRIRGPRSLDQTGTDLSASPEKLLPVLEQLLQKKQIVKGRLLVGVDQELYCDRQNFAFLYRRAVSIRRETQKPADRAIFFRFLRQWHFLNGGKSDLLNLLEKYQGLQLPEKIFEREILRPRTGTDIEEFTNKIAEGRFILCAHPQNSGKVNISLMKRGNGAFLLDQSGLKTKTNTILDINETDLMRENHDAKAIYLFLKENGKSPLQDIRDGTNLLLSQTVQGLQALVSNGLVSCDDYFSFFHVLQTRNVSNKTPRPFSSGATGRRLWVQTKHRNLKFAANLLTSHWFLTTSFAVMGRTCPEETKAEQQAYILLNRYGILVKEFYRKENGFLPWYEIFKILKRLEWQGKIRRGYFVKGLSGVQFATHQAVEIIQDSHKTKPIIPGGMTLLSTIDPALPFGGMVDWNLSDQQKQKISVTRSPNNHIILKYDKIILYSENFSRLWLTENYRPEMNHPIADALKVWLKLPPGTRPKNRIEISEINGIRQDVEKLTQILLNTGYERERNKIVLWPSGAEN